MAACPSCGKDSEAGARFCSACGTPLVADAPREVRKTVTVLFCDVTGSTALGERLDPEATRRLMTRYFESAREILERHGASVEKFIGDAVMAVFGIPQVHEDDALRAARAAIELRDSVTELVVRIGVNTGEVVAGAGETLVTGDAVNVAARLEQAAEPGTVLLGAQTYGLVRDAVEAQPVQPVVAKGKTDPLVAYLLGRVFENATPFARRFDSALVGRTGELAQIRNAYTRAVDQGTCNLFTVLGPPGIGKSRLAREFTAGLSEDALVLHGRCLSYGDGITYWPLVQILRDLAPEPDDIVELLAHEPDARRIVTDVFAALGETTTRPEETSRAVRRLLEGLARDRPLVVLLDDLHWAEPTFLDLVEHVADLSRDAPILLLCLARPDLVDARPGWGGGRHNATTLLLDALSGDETDALMAALAGSGLDGKARARIAAAADGNPLFVEQILAMWGDDGADGDLQIPPTIQSLLAARLDRLEPTERSLIECAAVIGKEFWLGAIADLGADPAALPALARKELIRTYQSKVFTTDDAYLFRHDLIRDAAYESIPKEMRAKLHEHFADWIGRQISEFDEIVGYHLEQAYRYRGELGEPAPELAARAGTLLAGAGLRADDRGDIPAAINLLTRAVALLPLDDERRIDLLLHLGYAHLDAGALPEADAAFSETADRALATGQPAYAVRARVGRHGVNSWGLSELTAMLDAIEQDIETLEELNDPLGLAEAYREAAKIHGHLGRTEAADRFFALAVENARLGGNRRIESDVVLWRFAMQCWGYMPANRGRREAEELLEQGITGLAEAFARIVGGRYRALQGDLVGGRAEIEAGRALVRDIGAGLYIAGSGQEHGECELEAGHPAEAESVLRDTFERYKHILGGSLSATAAAMLARALVDQGKLDEAEQFARISQEAAQLDDVFTQIDWRDALSRVLARRGDLAAGEALAREAVALAEPTDYLEAHARSLLALAEVLALADRGDEGRPFIERAILLYERKESVVGAERARARLRELAREPLAERD